MAATPPLKIKLRLTQPAADSNASSASSTTESPKLAPKKRKRSSRPVARRRPTKAASTTAADTPTSNAEDDIASGSAVGDEASSKPAAKTVSQTSQARKDLLKHKDTHSRHWQHSPLVFHTLGGFTVELPGSWQSSETMTLNKHATEPTSVADIDQLFSTSGEKDFRPFLCTHSGCSKSFTSYDQLQTHETNMHGTKNLRCGIDGCHKSFVTSGQMTKHQKMVHFRGERRARREAAAAASEVENETTTPVATTPSATADDMIDEREESVDIGNSED